MAEVDSDANKWVCRFSVWRLDVSIVVPKPGGWVMMCMLITAMALGAHFVINPVSAALTSVLVVAVILATAKWELKKEYCE